MRQSHVWLVRLLLLTTCFVPIALIYRQMQQRRNDIALVAAVQRYDYASVLAYLHQGANPNARDDARMNTTFWQLFYETIGLRKRVISGKGHPALLIAIEQRDLQTANALTTQSAIKINGEGPGMNEAVVRATLAGYKDLAWLLIRRGAARTPEECTPLLAAAAAVSNLDIARYALAHQANINVYSQFSDADVIGRPLSLAVENNCEKMVALLLENGADADIVRGDESPVTTAADHGNTPILKMLLAHGAQVNTSIRFGTALCFAAEKGHLQAAKILVALGADVNYNAYGGSILTHATRSDDCPEGNRVQVMRLLLSKGARVDDPVKGNWTALLSYAYTNQIEAATLLLNHGADVNHVSRRGKTPLNLAASEGYYEMARLLLKWGARRKITYIPDEEENAKPKVMDAVAVAKDARMRRLLQQR